MSIIGEAGTGVCKCCVGGAHKGVAESLEEMDFQRSLAGAAQVGDVRRMRELLARGAEVDGGGESGYAPLHYAARNGHVQACLLLLQNGAQVDRRTRSGKATSLHRAAFAGHIEVVKVLLQHGASVEAQDSDGQTPIHKASMQRHPSVMKLLTESCPRACRILDNQGRTA
ncbi:uncharacterized protein [Physcomitrium patens]|uniref:Uncharacterized protein n=1 Tax=Physcomitrium patens TaxID=3218 RepID=A0A2K1KE49_PHYPA|nr:ankyrin repeat domain-containing protein 39-like [Physcomitrium patens]PNR52054.1 hypothetical protein PHYPA_008428 [Physcomitrium patens]|eukprot:XP_024377482.1 ankyrin repeat domain-containing protein 39-like [Physcomitrella patens]